LSATNRGGQRSEADYYPTPSWCVERLLQELTLPGGAWLEPAAGDGSIIRAVGRGDIDWTAVEIRKEMGVPLKRLRPAPQLVVGDFLRPAGIGRKLNGGRPFEVAITNPPFSLAQEFIERCMEVASVTVMLLRLNYLASKKRWAFMTTHAPDVYVLPSRPS
jgi:hypothetical protein